MRFITSTKEWSVYLPLATWTTKGHTHEGIALSCLCQGGPISLPRCRSGSKTQSAALPWWALKLEGSWEII